MKEDKFTPGPWAVHPRAPLAVYHPRYECWLPQDEYDAHLISAAPELYESLLEMVEEMDCDDQPGAGLKWHAKATAALAKARGEVQS